ncbi:hypothetical protein CAMSH0001_0401 [Campylobacter showae RM3277]|uniref:Uncharacterized protein n=1 Tax=Campylobacter showae RM3277 TaxID=553219 RepID=C6RF96_9BACT|nr:hypothetical protein CAMSH0001_0401 [Campylobacter showae RM3277]
MRVFERKFIALNLTYSPRFLKLVQNLICSNKLARILPLKRLDKVTNLSNLNNCCDNFANNSKVMFDQKKANLSS